MLPPRTTARGQALIEFALVAGGFLLLLAAAFSLIPRSLLPLWVDEQIACSLLSASPASDRALLREAHQGVGLLPPGGKDASIQGGERRAAALVSLLPASLFPGKEREEGMTVPVSPLLPRASLEAPLALASGGSRVSRRLRMVVLHRVPEEEVKRLVDRCFLGGLADRAGILEPLRLLGLDPVRVNLDALPRGKN